MRTDTLVGLNAWSKRLINRKLKGAREVGQIVFPDGKTVKFEREVREVKLAEVVGYIRGRYRQYVAPRRRYTMHDGRVLTEVVQNIAHCGGPNYFVALVDEKGNFVPQSLWTEERMSM